MILSIQCPWLEILLLYQLAHMITQRQKRELPRFRQVEEPRSMGMEAIHVVVKAHDGYAGKSW